MPLYYNPEEPMPPQHEDWTCAACSLAWLNRALGIDHATDEYAAANYIGVPDHINSQYGLMDGSGRRLVDCLREQGAPAFNVWPSWSQAYELAMIAPLLIGGVGWNHWVGVRVADGDKLLLANSAPGWCGIDQELVESDWLALGPFAVVAVPLLVQFPQIQGL